LASISPSPQLIKGKRHLLVIERIDPQLFRSGSVLSPLQHGDDGFEPADPVRIGSLVRLHLGNLGFMGGDFRFQCLAPLLGRIDLGLGSRDHRLEGVDVVWELMQIGRVHAAIMAQNAPDCLAFCAP
jgi:hypothetical protein